MESTSWNSPGGDRTQAHATLKVLAAVLPLGLLAACSAAGGSSVAQPQRPAVARKIAGGLLVGPATPLDVTGRITAKLLGHPPVAWTLTKVAMATDKVGWAAGKGPGAAALPYLALQTTDGGRIFSLAFVAPEPIVAVSTPDARHAFFLEQNCVNGGLCSNMLQAGVPAHGSPPRSGADRARRQSDSVSRRQKMDISRRPTSSLPRPKG